MCSGTDEVLAAPRRQLLSGLVHGGHVQAQRVRRTQRQQAAGVHAGGALGLPDVLFYVIAAVTVAGAAGVALSRNILYSAIGLLMALLGAGALYVFLAADFLAVTQLLVYIGGVLILILFAVMLTNRIGQRPPTCGNQVQLLEDAQCDASRIEEAAEVL